MPPSSEAHSATDMVSARPLANQEAVERLVSSDPYLVGIAPAIGALPGMESNMILASGPPMPWPAYTGGQRRAIIGAALFEGLAGSESEAVKRLDDGEIVVESCHDHAAVGSLAGVYSASMPVLVVEDRYSGTFGHCNLFEGASTKRLNYGTYDSDVAASLRLLNDVIAPEIAAALDALGGELHLRPLIRKALHMGDELHSRNTAATALFVRELLPGLVRRPRRAELDLTLEYLSNDYFFLRVGMAAAKAAADAAHGIVGSSIVTALGFSCREFGVRVSGLGDTWFRAGIPGVEAKLFDGFSADDIEVMGGESTINETVGLGGFAQAAAFGLQAYQGGSVERMVEMNREMYDITVAEHPEYTIPYFGFRGVPVGIDVDRVVGTGITPVMDVGVAGTAGGQIGAGTMRAPLACFESAAAALGDADQ